MDNWILGFGPTFTIPSSTSKSLGRQQWAMGPAAVVGHKTPDYVLGVFPQYFWKLADRGDQKSTTPDASYMSLLYFGFINLPNAWQIGFNPSITYDRKATGGNKWNVPIGMGFSKTVRMGEMPVIPVLGGVLGRQPGRLRQEGAYQAERHSRDSHADQGAALLT